MEETTRGQHRRGEGRIEGRHRGGRSEHSEGRSAGAKTFRRGRAIAFLEHLEIQRDALKKQLTMPELQAINLQIVGELKATEMMIEQFIKMFELHELEQNKDEC